MNKRKICIITGSRAEYGLLYWLIKEIEVDKNLKLQLIATGMHLSSKFGLTHREIKKDFKIDKKIEGFKSDAQRRAAFASGYEEKGKKKKKEGVNEGRYHDWRNDESMTPKQKIGKSMREIRDALNELDKTVKMNLKLKTELNMNSKDYWKNTHKALTKISERLVKMANKVGNLK